MIYNKRFKRIIQAIVLGILTLMVLNNEVYAQFSLGVDFNSRYVWRGFDFGNSPSIQPELTFSKGGFEIGAWAAYASNGNPSGTEIDWFASYTFETTAGDFSVFVTDYTFPDDPVDYFSEDAHYVEVGLSFASEFKNGVGYYLSGGLFVHNDDDNSVYGELGLEFEVEDVLLTVFGGFSPTESAAYGNTSFAFINTGISATKEVKLSEYVSVDVSTSLITNPHANTMFFVFGFGIGF